MIKEIKHIRMTSKMRYNIMQMKIGYLSKLTPTLFIENTMFGYYDTEDKRLNFNYKKFLKECGLSQGLITDYHMKPIISELLFELLPSIDSMFNVFTINLHQ